MITTTLTTRRLTVYQHELALFSLRRPLDSRNTLLLRDTDILMLKDNREQLLWRAPDGHTAQNVMTELTAALHGANRRRTTCLAGGALLAVILSGLTALFSLASTPTPDLPDFTAGGFPAGHHIAPPPPDSTVTHASSVRDTASGPVAVSVQMPTQPASDSSLAMAAESPVQPAPQMQPTPAAQPGSSTLSPADFKAAQQALAQNLKHAAGKHYFTIPLSTGHARTLYVFADPLCPHCRTFEPALQALSASVNITVFPVTLIGKTDTQKAVTPVLCAPYASRPVLWRRLFDEGAGMLNIAHPDAPLPDCEVGKIALMRNDRALALYHLPGTPTVISDDGRMVPLLAMASQEALNTFLKGKS